MPKNIGPDVLQTAFLQKSTSTKGCKIKSPAGPLERLLRSSSPRFSTKKTAKKKNTKQGNDEKPWSPDHTKPTEQDSDHQTPSPTPHQMTRNHGKPQFFFLRLRRFRSETLYQGAVFSKTPSFLKNRLRCQRGSFFLWLFEGEALRMKAKFCH